jgi:uncharacterized protein
MALLIGSGAACPQALSGIPLGESAYAKTTASLAFSRIVAATIFAHRKRVILPHILAAIAATYLLAGFIKGVIGGGLPTISIGILGLVMPIPDAVALVVLPSFITNVWQSLGPRLWPLFKRLWLMLAGICIGAFLGRDLMTGAYREWTEAVIGLTKLKLHLDPHYEKWVAPPVGIATGFIAAGTGVFVIPSGPYLQAIGLRKNDLVQSLGITYTISTIVLALITARAGALNPSILWPSLLAVAAALIGMLIGQRLLSRLEEDTFRKIFFAALLLLGVHIVIRSLL